MTVSEFWRAVADEFGESYGRVLTADLVLGDVGGVTASQALKSGAVPRQVWLALCRACDVPEERRHGAGRPEPKSH